MLSFWCPGCDSPMKRGKPGKWGTLFRCTFCGFNTTIPKMRMMERKEVREVKKIRLNIKDLQAVVTKIEDGRIISTLVPSRPSKHSTYQLSFGLNDEDDLELLKRWAFDLNQIACESRMPGVERVDLTIP